VEPNVSRILDLEEVSVALERAAYRATHGTREERSGRFLQSPTILSVEYDEATRKLDVTFAGGRTYRYLDVPPEIYTNLLDAKSKGYFFIKNIRGTFAHDEVKGRMKSRQP
jgi:hypothetical protein